jgi:hypothetical protein
MHEAFPAVECLPQRIVRGKRNNGSAASGKEERLFFFNPLKKIIP